MWANERPRVVVDYDADPNDRYASSLLSTLWRTVQSRFTAPYLPADDDPSRTFTGYVANTQGFMGAAFLAGNPVQYTDGGYPTIDTGLIEGPMGDPARRIFADRLRRRGK